MRPPQVAQGARPPCARAVPIDLQIRTQRAERHLREIDAGHANARHLPVEHQQFFRCCSRTEACVLVREIAVHERPGRREAPRLHAVPMPPELLELTEQVAK
jgi:hypothetical protein